MELQQALQTALQQQARLKLQLQKTLSHAGAAPLLPSLTVGSPPHALRGVDGNDPATSLQLQAEAELAMLREEVAHLRTEATSAETLRNALEQNADDHVSQLQAELQRLQQVRRAASDHA